MIKDAFGFCLQLLFICVPVNENRIGFLLTFQTIDALSLVYFFYDPYFSINLTDIKLLAEKGANSGARNIFLSLCPPKKLHYFYNINRIFKSKVCVMIKI